MLPIKTGGVAQYFLNVYPSNMSLTGDFKADIKIFVADDSTGGPLS